MSAFEGGLSLWTMTREAFAPVLTAWYPWGLSVEALIKAEADVEKVAAKIKEPVALVFRSAAGENVRRLYLPATARPERTSRFSDDWHKVRLFGKGFWLPVYSPALFAQAEEEPLAAAAILPFEEAFALEFAGRARLSRPVMLIETNDQALTVGQVKARVLGLCKKARRVVWAYHNEKIVCGHPTKQLPKHLQKRCLQALSQTIKL